MRRQERSVQALAKWRKWQRRTKRKRLSGNAALAAKDVHLMYRAASAPKPEHWVVKAHRDAELAREATR